jgi:hypothetical protein
MATKGAMTRWKYLIELSEMLKKSGLFLLIVIAAFGGCHALRDQKVSVVQQYIIEITDNPESLGGKYLDRINYILFIYQFLASQWF